MTKKQINQLSYEITGVAISVHRELGAGLLESVYEKCMIYELTSKGYEVSQQLSAPVIYKGIIINTRLKLDLLVNDCIIIELKTVEVILPIHVAQLYTYMRILKKPHGLLINFLTKNIRSSMKSLVNDHFSNLPD
jgi:GxxExxY protein